MTGPSPAVATAGEDSNRRVAFEVADVVRACGADYLRTHPTSAAQRRVLRALRRCRTAALGGHVEGCGACGYTRVAYNSCRNRHCPKCQGQQRAKWMAAEQAMLLPVDYFHVVFTLPHVLNALLRLNPRRLYGLLFRTAAATLRTFARDPRHLGAEPAITMVLHTWGQTLAEHVHVHCVVSGGGLSLDGTRWVALPRRRFLFPVRALSAVFRRKYLAALTRLRRAGALRFAGQSAALADPTAWDHWVAGLRHTPWVVYAKPPFGGPACVLKYLSRYTHRVAIANRRILFVGNGVVRFAWTDYADHHAHKSMTLAAGEFLRRFLLHVLPTGFMRIRHYGLLANAHRQRKLQRCREVLHVPTPTALAPHTERFTAERAPASPPRDGCPVCGGTLHRLETLAPHPPDTS